jgi:hypothetical protein
VSQVPSQVALVNGLPAWLSVQQAADYCGVDHGEMYKMLRNLEIRRIGVRGVTPYGRPNRVKRESVLRLRGQPETPSAELSRWHFVVMVDRTSLPASDVDHRGIHHWRLGVGAAI